MIVSPLSQPGDLDQSRGVIAPLRDPIRVIKSEKVIAFEILLSPGF